jgi:hypothetical protein
MKRIGLLTLAGVVLAGCGGKTVVGDWTASNVSVAPGVTGTTDQSFAGDKTFKSSTKISAMGLTITVDVTGTYEIARGSRGFKDEGDKLTMTAKTMDVKGLPPQLKAQENMFKQGLGKAEEYTLKWAENGNLSLTPVSGKGPSLDLVRKKS